MILVTDFGHDPDDAIALSYLIENDVIPECIVLTPGHDNQIKCLNGFLKLYDLSVRIIKAVLSDSTSYNPGKHKLFFNNKDVTTETLLDIEKLIFKKGLVIGPPKNAYNRIWCDEIYIQGGYSPNSIKPLEKFINIRAAHSFNPGGAPEDFKWLLTQTNNSRFLVGKNVCHGYTMKDIGWKPTEPTVNKFFNLLSPNKKAHDVLAAKMFMDNSHGIWERAMPIKTPQGYTTLPTEKNIFSLIGLTEDVD